MLGNTYLVVIKFLGHLDDGWTYVCVYLCNQL